MLIKKKLGYPVTCLKFYANKEDLKVEHQKMVAATCENELNLLK